MAITTSVDVVNLGLLLIGAKKLDSLAEDKKTAELATLIYEQTRDECFELPIDWHFATVRATKLTAHTNTPNNGQFDYYYVLPSGCARVIAVVDVNGDTTQYPWRREMDVDGSTLTAVLACNETDVYIKYVKVIENIAYWPAWFKKLVGAAIALMLTQPVKQDDGRMVNPLLGTWYRAWNAAKSGNAAWGADTNDRNERLDYGNMDVLEAASSEIEFTYPRIVER